MKLANSKTAAELFKDSGSLYDLEGLTEEALKDILLGLSDHDEAKLKQLVGDSAFATNKGLDALTLIGGLGTKVTGGTTVEVKEQSTVETSDETIDWRDALSSAKKTELTTKINNRISSISKAKGELSALDFKGGETTQAAKTIFLEVPFSFSTDLADNLTGGINFAPGYGSLTIVQTTTKQQTGGKMATLTSEQKGKTFSLSGEAFFDYDLGNSFKVRFAIGGSAFGGVETTNKLTFTENGKDVTDMTSKLFKLNENKVDDANKPFFSMYNLKVGVGFNTSL